MRSYTNGGNFICIISRGTAKWYLNAIHNVDEKTSGRESHDMVTVAWDNKKKESLEYNR